MPRRRRNTDADVSTSKASQDRATTWNSKGSPSEETRAPSASEGADTKAKQTSRGPTNKEELNKLIKKVAEKPIKPKTAMCPKCHEKRFNPELKNTTVKCINCRQTVVLI